MYLLFSVLWATSLLALVTAVPNENGVEFLSPTKGQVVRFMDTINVIYTSSFPKPLLLTFCRTHSGDDGIVQIESIETQAFNGSRLYTLDYKGRFTSCYWDLRNGTTAGSGGVSPDVTIKKGGGMSTGAKAGIGAGIAVVAVIAIAGLVFFCVKKRRNKLQKPIEKGHETPGAGEVEAGGYHTAGEEKDQSDGSGARMDGKPNEMPDNSDGAREKVGELPAYNGPTGGQVHELGGEVYELGGETRAVEAPAEEVKREK